MPVREDSSAIVSNGVHTNGVHVNGAKLNGFAKLANGHHAPSAEVKQASPASTPLPSRTATLLSVFLDTFGRVEAHRKGKDVHIDGYSLSVADVVATGRFNTPVSLDDSAPTRSKAAKSARVIQDKLDNGLSVYGVSTGYGGSADTRTHSHIPLGRSCLQHQHAGVLPTSSSIPPALPLLDPLAGLSMPESWVRAAILIRTNSLIRGHSGVQWDLMEAMASLLNENITPVVPLRGSISASGDLSPLSYVAGTLYGNPGIRVFDGPAQFGPRQMSKAPDALAAHGLKPHVFSAKDHLGLLNGTAFSAAVASLALYDAIHLALLAQVCTAMGTEALLGCQASHHPFINRVTRPHPGQIEASTNMWNLLRGSGLAQTGEEEEVTIEEDAGKLRQDRYPLRTSPQFIGPQLEDMLSAFISVTQECNSTTDNPLVDGETGTVHHGGNFQAMAVTNAMEKTRLSLHHLGKLLFSQLTEILNPLFNRGLPPNLAGTDPSINYHCKGVDIASAAYVSELGFLASPVSTHIQSAELHNQAVNSLALISGRQTITAIDVLTCLVASYLYCLCQALDLRAQQALLAERIESLVSDGLSHFTPHLSPSAQPELLDLLLPAIMQKLDETSTMDASDRAQACLAATTTPLVDYFLGHDGMVAAVPAIPAFRADVAARVAACYDGLRRQFLAGELGATPASAYLGKTRPVYEFVRVALGIRYHGVDNYDRFENGFTGPTIGENVSLIYESIRDGKMQPVIASLFAQ